LPANIFIAPIIQEIPSSRRSSRQKRHSSRVGGEQHVRAGRGKRALQLTGA
jgi:hypothetical protein